MNASTSDPNPPLLRPAPKNLQQNLDYREAILKRAAGDPNFQLACRQRATNDLIWWLDTFGWTYDPRKRAPAIPFVSYPFQETCLHRIAWAIDAGQDLVAEKTRDMGLTWLVLATMAWRFTFHPYQSFLCVSAKEEMVDKRGDPKTHFWKLRFLFDHLPAWMRPELDPVHLHLGNLANGSTIDGESTQADTGRGDRRTAILLDEFSSVPEAFQVLAATRDVSNCRLFPSTPKGIGNAFYSLREKLAGTPQLLTVHWSLHPHKAAGLYRDAAGKLRSPWYDMQCQRAGSPQEIAQELDIAYAESGWQFFGAQVIEGLLAGCRPPLLVGELDADWEQPTQAASFFATAGGRLKLWAAVDSRGRLLGGPEREYVIGCDIATGKAGDMSSQSVASVVDRRSGEKVAEFATNSLMPYEFARSVVSLCRYFQNAFLIWEENGPGGEFTKEILSCGYRNLFYREDERLVVRKKTDKPGWRSTPESKRLLLSQYQVALIHGDFLNPSREAIVECSEYVHHPSGKIEHSRALAAVDPTVSGENHGDRVIADALANRGRLDRPMAAAQHEEQRAAPGSLAWLRQQRREQQQQEETW